MERDSTSTTTPTAELSGNTAALAGDGGAPRNKRAFGPGNAYPPYRSKVGEELREEHRADYEALILRKTTLRALVEWLRARGYEFGKGAVGRHRIEFMRDYREVERASRTALRFARLARRSGATMSDATIGGLHQILMEFFTRQLTTAALTAKDVDLLASAVDRFIGTSDKVARVRKELAGATGAEREADGTTVVNRVREILGMPPIDAPDDEEEVVAG